MHYVLTIGDFPPRPWVASVGTDAVDFALVTCGGRIAERFRSGLAGHRG